MDSMNDGRGEDRLSALLAAYRQACPDPDGSSDFMPKLWQKIDRRRTDSVLIFRRLAQVCALAAIALTLFIGTLLIPRVQADVPDTSTYVDALAAEHSTDFADVAPGGDIL